MRRAYRTSGRVANVGNKARLGALLKQLTFYILEQTSVGQIVDPLATSFEMVVGGDTFSVDNSGIFPFYLRPIIM